MDDTELHKIERVPLSPGLTEIRRAYQGTHCIPWGEGGVGPCESSNSDRKVKHTVSFKNENFALIGKTAHCEQRGRTQKWLKFKLKNFKSNLVRELKKNRMAVFSITETSNTMRTIIHTYIMIIQSSGKKRFCSLWFEKRNCGWKSGRKGQMGKKWNDNLIVGDNSSVSLWSEKRGKWLKSGRKWHAGHLSELVEGWIILQSGDNCDRIEIGDGSDEVSVTRNVWARVSLGEAGLGWGGRGAAPPFR